MKRLQPVVRYAREWHQGRWTTGDLADRLNAVLLIERVNGGGILAMSCNSPKRRSIAIDDRLVGTSRYNPALCHEGAHFLLDAGGIHTCSLDASSPGERFAWYGAAILAIPEAMIREHEAERMSAREIAKDCVVPLEFVDLRYTLHTVLHHDTAITRQEAAQSLDRWMRYVRRYTAWAATQS